mgnify:CR=1 FL=1
MSSPLHKAASVWSLMTRIPIALRAEPDYAEADWMIPTVGLGAAAAAAAGAGLGALVFGPGVLAAVVATGAQYLAFNLFHFDGLCDTADAMGAFGDEDKRRAALKDPRIGSFGLFGGLMAMAARLGSLSALLSAGGLAPWAALALAPVAGRFGAVVIACSAKPAGRGGLGAALGAARPLRAALGYALAAAPGALLFGAIGGPAAAGTAVLAGAAAGIAVGLAVGRWYERRLGGYSGDALGAALELGELLILCGAAAVLR